MKFHYEKHHKLLAETCPPESYIPENTKVYRWVFNEIDDPNNFISQYEKKPRRFNAKSDLNKCGAMALSMYKDLNYAKKRFRFFRDEMQMKDKVYRILGTKIAEALLESEDGVNETDENGNSIKSGHFNHHPAEGYNYSEKFKIVFTFEK